MEYWNYIKTFYCLFILITIFISCSNHPSQNNSNTKDISHLVNQNDSDSTPPKEYWAHDKEEKLLKDSITLNISDTSNEQILKALFDSVENEVAYWKPESENWDESNYNTPFSNTVLVINMLEKYIYFNSIFNNALIAFFTIGPSSDCHGCSGITGYVIFNQEKNKWKLHFINFVGPFGGSYGNGPDSIRICSLGKNKPGLIAYDWEAGGGYFYTEMNIYKIFPDSIHLVSNNIELKEDNEGKAYKNLAEKKKDPFLYPYYEWNSTVSFKKNDNKEFYDLVVKSFGTHLKEGGEKTEKFSITRIYQYKNGKYLPLKPFEDEEQE